MEQEPLPGTKLILPKTLAATLGGFATFRPADATSPGSWAENANLTLARFD